MSRPGTYSRARDQLAPRGLRSSKDAPQQDVGPQRPSDSGDDMEITYVEYPTQQPGEGFWAVAAGCADLSEGMVWVAIHREPKRKP